MKKLIFIITLFFAIQLSSQAQEIEYFNGNWELVLQHAKKTKQPILVDFYTSWCGFCKKMDRTTFRDTAVTKFVKKNFIAYKLDAEKGEGIMLARKHGVRGYPTIVYFDHKGNRMAVDPGYKTSAGFLTKLKKYKEQSRTKLISDMSESMRDYFKVKRKYIDELEVRIAKKSDSNVQKMRNKALDFGKERNDFEFKELKYDARDMSEDVAIKIEMSYYEGANDLKRYNESVQKLIALESISKEEKHYHVLSLLENEEISLELIKAANSLNLKKETYQALDTKAAVQLMYGDISDAKETVNRALKVGKKKKQDTSSTKILKEIIGNEK